MFWIECFSFKLDTSMTAGGVLADTLEYLISNMRKNKTYQEVVSLSAQKKFQK